MIHLLIGIAMGALANTSTSTAILEKAIHSTGWCGRGIGVEKIATSRPWESSPSDKAVILTDPPIGTIRFEVLGAHVVGTAFVNCREKVAAARTDFGPGESLTDKNVKWIETDVAYLSRSGFYRSTDELKSLESRGFVRAGTLLSRMQVQNARWVVGGSPVDLVHEGAHFKIRALAKALQSGGQNDWIRVENSQTHKIVIAQVVAKGSVITRGSHASN